MLLKGLVQRLQRACSATWGSLKHVLKLHHHVSYVDAVDILPLGHLDVKLHASLALPPLDC
jgi:hypothetical protein